VTARRAVISLGTNTVRLLIVEDGQEGGVHQLEHRAIGTRLGEGLVERGMLADAAMDRTLDAVRSFVALARANGARLTGIATSAMRRAENASAFAQRFAQIAGVPLRVIDGEEEAASSFRGATYDDGAQAHRVAVLDIGGGSTECAVGMHGRVERSVSLEIGTVRLTERFPELSGSAPGAPARNAAQRAHVFVGNVAGALGRFGPIEELRAVAGTPATIGAILAASDVDHVRGMLLSRGSVAFVRDRLLDASLEERRRIPGMLAQRADVLAAGCIILLEALDYLGCSGARVETNDLLLGQLLTPE